MFKCQLRRGYHAHHGRIAPTGRRRLSVLRSVTFFNQLLIMKSFAAKPLLGKALPMPARGFADFPRDLSRRMRHIAVNKTKAPTGHLEQ